MSNWQVYLQTLTHEPVRVTSQRFGTVFSTLRGVSEERLFLSPLNVSALEENDFMKLQFTGSKLKNVRFNAKALHISESQIEVKLIDCEVEGNRISLTELQRFWEKQRGLN